MVEGMSVVVNVTLSLMSVVNPPPVLGNLSVRTVVKLCTIGVFALGGQLVFLNYDVICMRFVNEQFELIEFVFYSVYVDLQYDEIYLIFYCCVCVLVWWLYSCGRPWTVCEVVLVPYVDAVVVVTVMRLLLFVLHVCMLSVCEGMMVTEMLVRGMEDMWLW